jgi:hypothetical protein
MEGDHKHDYSQIRVPVLALVGFPEFPQDQIQKNHVMDPADRIIFEAVFGTYLGMTSTALNVLREMTAFLPKLR